MSNPDLERALSSDVEGNGHREWLVTNGLGGYASGTVSGLVTRRFHGWLIAALPAPHGRTMMFNKLMEIISVGDAKYRLSPPSGLHSSPTGLMAVAPLIDFRLEDGLPVWVFGIDGARLERRVLMAYGQNTTYVVYRLLGGDTTVRLELEPWLNFVPMKAR